MTTGQRRTTRRQRRQRGSGLSNVLPTTTWGSWASYPGALAWSASTEAPAPLANGGLYTGAQSTGPWASQPLPATQYAFAVEAAKTAMNPEVFFHQRPNDNSGASFSPYVGQAVSNEHYSATAPAFIGGRRKATRKSRKARKALKSRRNNRKH